VAEGAVPAVAEDLQAVGDDFRCEHAFETQTVVSGMTVELLQLGQGDDTVAVCVDEGLNAPVTCQALQLFVSSRHKGGASNGA
jgi:6-phosphogluconate dehydrogenase (decarboxylating)